MFAQKFLIPILLVVLVLAIGIVLLSAGIWNPPWNPFKAKTAKDFITQALENTLDADTYKFEGDIAVEIKVKPRTSGSSTSGFNPFEPAGGSAWQELGVGLNFSGSSDRKDKQNPKAEINLDVNLNIPVPEVPPIFLQAEVRYLNETLYILIKSLPSILPMIFPSEDFSQFEDQWFRLDLKRLQEAENNTTGLSKLNKEDQEELLSDLKNLVSGKSIFAVKEKLSKEDVNGKKAEHYLVSLNKETVKEIGPEFFEIMEGYVSPENEKTYQSGKEKLLKEWPQKVDQIWQETGGLEMDIWISDDKVVKMRWEKEIDLSESDFIQDQYTDYIEQAKMNILIEILFFDFDKEIHIEEPQDTKPVEDLFGISRAQSRAKDARMMAAMTQARTVIVLVKVNDGNYDKFSCVNEEMAPWCQEVEKSGSILQIAKNKAKNSTEVCIWAKLSSTTEGDKWYCADSTGMAGETSVNPADPKYCFQGKSAKCPLR